MDMMGCDYCGKMYEVTEFHDCPEMQEARQVRDIQLSEYFKAEEKRVRHLPDPKGFVFHDPAGERKPSEHADVITYAEAAEKLKGLKAEAEKTGVPMVVRTRRGPLAPDAQAFQDNTVTFRAEHRIGMSIRRPAAFVDPNPDWIGNGARDRIKVLEGEKSQLNVVKGFLGKRRDKSENAIVKRVLDKIIREVEAKITKMDFDIDMAKEEAEKEEEVLSNAWDAGMSPLRNAAVNDGIVAQYTQPNPMILHPQDAAALTHTHWSGGGAMPAPELSKEHKNKAKKSFSARVQEALTRSGNAYVDLTHDPDKGISIGFKEDKHGVVNVMSIDPVNRSAQTVGPVGITAPHYHAQKSMGTETRAMLDEQLKRERRQHRG